MAVTVMAALPSYAGGRRVHFGAEWGVHCNFISLHESSFITADRYMVESSNMVYGSHVNGMLAVFAGYDIMKRWNVSLSTGCLGTQKGERVVPASVKVTAYLSDCAGTSSGSLVFLEAGSGFRAGAELSWLGRSGYGYRIPLAGPAALDVNASALFSYTHPAVYDRYSHKIVEKKDLGSSKSYNIGVLLSFAIVF